MSSDINKSNETVVNKSVIEEESNLDTLILINDIEVQNLIPIFVTVGIFMFVGIVGNTLVVQVYWCRMKRSAKRTFILSLALLDLGVCLLVIPFEMYDLRNQVLFFQEGLCKAMRVLEYATVLAAGFVLVSVSFERYYFLCRAFQEFSPHKAKLICVICVVAALLVSSPAAIFAGSKSRNIEHNGQLYTGFECSMNSEQNADGTLKRVYYYVLAIIFFGCLLVFVVLYAMIGRLLWKYQKGKFLPQIGSLAKSSTKRSYEAQEVKLTAHNSSGRLPVFSSSHKERHVHGNRCIKSAGTIVVFFSVTVVFVLSFLPHLAIRLVMFLDLNLQSDMDQRTWGLLYNFTVRSYLISNVANPFIYSILNKSFRKQLKRTIRFIRQCGPETI
ncbi:orexin receptor type 2-like [Dreissena polymorpha]|uniref:G-protein coupled receptors family 1 profile domain-containing protein n=1 Tax=Dreissena polymorpha TaxID=45954 RepID=A0A9D4RA27_DREPO|nr:orexin receptor type 2-like [Dreissena polymorpha]KAH3859157.1 hypothetical protein DPMN_101873 [Dreissena polymorpha]